LNVAPCAALYRIALTAALTLAPRLPHLWHRALPDLRDRIVFTKTLDQIADRHQRRRLAPAAVQRYVDIVREPVVSSRSLWPSDAEP
jgi:hypothetical protein